MKEQILVSIGREHGGGGRVIAQMIAQQLNISRTPVREALAILESEGLIEIRRGLGAFVKPLSYKDISHIFEVRHPLETLAVRTAIYRITPREIAARRESFNSILRRCENHERVPVSDFYRADAAFHDMIVERCENPYVQRFMHIINSNVRRMQLMFSNSMQDNLEEAARQHLLLLDLIEAQDIDALEAEMDRQLVIAKQRYVDV